MLDLIFIHLGFGEVTFWAKPDAVQLPEFIATVTCASHKRHHQESESKVDGLEK